MKRDDMRFKGVFSFFAPRIPVNEADGLFLSPGVEDLLEYLRINARLDAGSAEKRLDHGGVEELGGVGRQRLGHGVIHLLIQRSWENIGRQPGSQQRHADEILFKNRNIEFPAWIAQIISTVGRVIFQRSLMDLDQILDVAGDGTGTASERFAVLSLILRQFLGKISSIGIIVFPGFRNELQFSQKLLAFLIHDKFNLQQV